jgi:hypothetical protein
MPKPLATLAMSLLACLLVACGGDDATKPAGKDRSAGQTEPAAVALVRTSAAASTKASSGVIEAEVEIALKGVPEFAEPFSTRVSGPFSYRKGSALPDYELELGARDYGVTLTSVGGKSYVTVGTTAFELPASIRRRLVRNSGRGNGLTRTLAQLGVRPWIWETEERIVGTETIDGVKTTHLKTSFNAGRILRDANTLLGVMRSLGVTRATGLPPRIPARARRLFVSSVTSKAGQSWFGVTDKVRRKSGFVMKASAPRAKQAKLGGITRATVTGSLMVTEVGTPQTIAKPAQVGSYADFKLALDALGDAQEAK